MWAGWTLLGGELLEVLGVGMAVVGGAEPELGVEVVLLFWPSPVVVSRETRIPAAVGNATSSTLRPATSVVTPESRWTSSVGVD